MTQIDASLGSFSLRKSLQNDPQNLIFGACGAKKCEKKRVSGGFILWNRVPLKKISSRIATEKRILAPVGDGLEYPELP